MSTYGGSKLFDFIASASGLPIDQVNFLLCQLVALAFAFVYRIYFSPKTTSFMVRHVITLAVGISIGIFCFGRQMLHLFAQASGCYVLMKWAPSYAMHMCVFAFAMLYLSYMHIQRIIYDYGGYTLDVSLPMMMASQKLTTLAFSLHDGLYKKSNSLQFEQKQYAVSRMPHPVVFFSYILNFQGLLVGPMCFFNDYISFVEGKNFPIERPLTFTKEKDKKQHEELNPLPEVLKKVVAAFVAMGCSLVFTPIFPKIRNVDKELIDKTPFLGRIRFLLISVFFSRFRYYFAWKLGEGVNNASGLGFNGYHENGNQRWDLVSNVDILGVEMSTSLKGIVDNWNIQTAIWLKRICYERAPFAKTVLTYMLSAVWHGFYPGYYFSFVCAAFCTIAARSIRRNIRPHFKTNIFMSHLYDVITWFFAQLTLAYMVIPFTALEFKPILYFYTYSMYWFLHIGVFVVLIFLPYKPSKSKKPETNEYSSKHSNTNVISDQATEAVNHTDKMKEISQSFAQEKQENGNELQEEKPSENIDSSQGTEESSMSPQYRKKIN